MWGAGEGSSLQSIPWGHWQASSFWGKPFLPVSPCSHLLPQQPRDVLKMRLCRSAFNLPVASVGPGIKLRRPTWHSQHQGPGCGTPEVSTAPPSAYSLHLCLVPKGWREEIEGTVILSPRGQFGDIQLSQFSGAGVLLTEVS